MQPGPRKGPVPVGRAAGDAQGPASLADIESAKVLELDDLCFGRMMCGERVEQVADHDHPFGRWPQSRGRVAKLDPLMEPAVLNPPPLAGPLDENPPHGLGRRREEVAATLPRLIGPDEAEK